MGWVQRVAWFGDDYAIFFGSLVQLTNGVPNVNAWDVLSKWTMINYLGQSH
jgi:hypothetical protein